MSNKKFVTSMLNLERQICVIVNLLVKSYNVLHNCDFVDAMQGE